MRPAPPTAAPMTKPLLESSVASPAALFFMYESISTHLAGFEDEALKIRHVGKDHRVAIALHARAEDKIAGWKGGVAKG